MRSIPHLLLLVLLAAAPSLADSTSQQSFKVARKWSSLGPFPLGTREGPLLAALGGDIHRSPLVVGGVVEPQDVVEDDEGWVEVRDEGVEWNQLRSTSGWIVLQHRVFYTTPFHVSHRAVFAFDLLLAAEFSIERIGGEPEPIQNFNGGMYGYDSPPQYAELEVGSYLIRVVYHHDIRIAGEPPQDGVPTGRWRLTISRVEQEGLVAVSKVLPSLVGGVAMGSVLGIQISNIASSPVTLLRVETSDKSFTALLAGPVTFAPFQTLLVAIPISQRFKLEVANHGTVSLPLDFIFDTSTLQHAAVLQHSNSSPLRPIPFTGTFVSSSGTPSYSLFTPPRSLVGSCFATTVILALHGAGTDPAVDNQWTTSIPSRQLEWIVLPIGMTPWGTDWHGASLHDSLNAVNSLQDLQPKWNDAWGLEVEGCKRAEPKLVLFGHSNGGQGAWYFLSHFPDRVLGGVPASAYVKIEDYVPYSLSVGHHYRDPAFTGILSAALAPFANDLYASNLVGIPILVRHGSMDDNVPVQHGRQFVSIIDQWSGNASTAQYSEVPGAVHWFDGVFEDDIVLDFLDDLLLNPRVPPSNFSFTVTTANPDESGSKNGFRIVELETPGRIGRISVTISGAESSMARQATIKTTNVRSLSFEQAIFSDRTTASVTSIILNSCAPMSMLEQSEMMTLSVISGCSFVDPAGVVPRRYGPIINILTSSRPLRLVIGTGGSLDLTRHLTTIARRIAADEYSYTRLTCEIIMDVNFVGGPGNVVLLGDSFSNSVVRDWERTWPTPVTYPAPNAFCLHDRCFQSEGQGLLFLTPNPSDNEGLALVLSGIGHGGLERAWRLFPVRTGVPVPDWIVTSADPTSGGIEAAGALASGGSWRGSSRGGSRPASGSASDSNDTGRSGRGGTRAKSGRARGVSRGGLRTQSDNWRLGAEVDDGDNNPNDDDAGDMEDAAPLRDSPSAFGTPAFVGGGVFGGGGAFASSSSPFSVFSPASTQISTLEVLGEDSDSRKRRFETSLANNRFMELKPLREAQRVSDIKLGLIPDPRKPMRLDEATNFVGTCEDMCPEFEREEREYQKAVDLLERYPGTNRIDPSRAVKAFHRPAAGNDQPLPSDVRPPHILKKTLDYLFHTLLPTEPLHVTHPFLRDRTRAIRQDFTMQNERGAVVIECNERIARYHILALGTLRGQSGFSESQELEQLRKVLKSLNEFYDDARSNNPPLPTPNEPEFRSYNILTHLRDPDIIWSTEVLPRDVLDSPLLQTALALHSLAQKANISRGERASPNAFSRFFKLLARTDVPYLFACLLSSHFTDIRRNALETMKGAYIKQHSSFPCRTLVKILGCDDEDEVTNFCEGLGLEVEVGENNKAVVLLHKAATITNGAIPQRVSQRMVEGKRGSTSYRDVIDATNYVCHPVPPIPSSTHSPQSRRTSTLPPPKPLVAEIPVQPPASATFAPQQPSAFTFASPSPSTLPMASSPISTGGIPSPFGGFPSSTPSIPLPNSFSGFSTLPSRPPILNPTAPTFKPASSFQPPPAASSTSILPPTFQPPTPIAPPIANILPKATPPAPRIIKPIPSTALRAATTPISTRKQSVPLIATPKTSTRVNLARVVVESLSKDILDEVLSLRIRRIAELALQDRWSLITFEERSARDSVISNVTRGLLDTLIHDVARLLVVETIVRDKGERRLERQAWNRWLSRTTSSIELGEKELQRWETWQRAKGEIGSKSTVEPEEAEFEDGDADLDLSGLSLSATDDSSTLLDLDMAEKLVQVSDETFSTLKNILTVPNHKQAKLARERLWAPGSFLEIIAQRVDTALSRRSPSPHRPTWSTLISTPRTSSPFASWLACKFSLDETSLQSSIDTSEADIEVQMADQRSPPSRPILNHAGLLLFDCTMSSNDLSQPSSWNVARQRLLADINNINRQSFYFLSLLVIVCPDRLLNDSETISLTAKVGMELGLSTLTGLRKCSVLIMRLERAETQLEKKLTTVLSDVVVRPERVLRPLSSIAEVLLTSWKSKLLLALRIPTAASSPVRFVGIFVDSLQQISNETWTRALPPRAPLSLPPFPSEPRSLRPAILAYIDHPHLAFNGFPLVRSRLSEWPPVSDAVLARTLLEHLADFVLTAFANAKTQQEHLDSATKLLLPSLQHSLGTNLNRFEQETVKLIARDKEREGMKRKASASPLGLEGNSVAIASKKVCELETPKTTSHAAGVGASALLQLMKETSKLLSN